MKIKIVSLPPGGAPLPIRRAWIGSEMKSITNKEIASIPPDEWTGPTPNEHGYIVRVSHAIHSLEKRGEREAAEFWRRLIPLGLGHYMSFLKDCCIILEKT